MQISNGTVHYAGDGGVRRISFVDAIDQSVDDSGRFMNMSGAVGGNEIELFFTVNRLLFPSRGIHFLTYVYGEATIANEDFRYGQIVRATELLYRLVYYFHLILNLAECGRHTFGIEFIFKEKAVIWENNCYRKQ